MTTRIIGDIHGKMQEYYDVISTCDSSIQIGDFGIGFASSDYWYDKVNSIVKDGHRFIHGNHDNPTKCKDMVGFIENGTVENSTMFIGGAWSIDNPNAPPGWYRRTVGYDWWDNEECSTEEFELFVDVYAQTKPDIMITHDCPDIISKIMFFDSGLIKGPRYNTKTASYLESMFKIHQPKFWFFGHWHCDMILFYNKTRFVCLNEMSFIDVDLNDYDQISNAIDRKFGIV